MRGVVRAQSRRPLTNWDVRRAFSLPSTPRTPTENNPPTTTTTVIYAETRPGAKPQSNMAGHRTFDSRITF